MELLRFRNGTEIVPTHWYEPQYFFEGPVMLHKIIFRYHLMEELK